MFSVFSCTFLLKLLSLVYQSKHFFLQRMGCGSSNEVEELNVNTDEKVIYFTNHSIKCSQMNDNICAY